VYREPSVVDVLLHHRGTESRAADDAYAALFVRTASTLDELLTVPASRFAALHGWNGEAVVPSPTGFTAVLSGASAVHRLPEALDVFMPRALSIDLNLIDVPYGPFVMLVAVPGSGAESAPAPAGLTASSGMATLVRAWPRAAMRIVHAEQRRPVPVP